MMTAISARDRDLNPVGALQADYASSATHPAGVDLDPDAATALISGSSPGNSTQTNVDMDSLETASLDTPRTASSLKVLPAPEPDTVRDIVLASLDDDRATDIISIDLAGRSPIADFMIIANGASTRQVSAMAQHVRDKLSASGVKQIRVEGMPQCDWVIIDAGDVVVNLFRPEVRDFYQLEKMWLEPMEDAGRSLEVV